MVDFPYPAPILASKIWNCVKEWDFESKVLSVTLDNTSVNDACIPFLLSNVKEKNALIFEGKFLHVRCASHVLNLIVQDGLGVIGKIIYNVRTSVRYVGFYNATNVVSRVKYPISNMYFHEMFRVKLLLDEVISNTHDFIRSMIIRMQLKFNKY
uniref:Putative AC transposase n=1 Tax=Anthurium amnicola TaxID=1678845 RepID=A0A1D1Z8V3_9ARAE